MSDNLKTTLLFVALGLSVINSVILFTNDEGVSYEKTETTASPINNAALNNAQPIQTNNEATIIENTGPKTSIQFGEMDHDFGDIDQNTQNPKTFTFTNTGSEPLIISDAKGSCGCTVPNYPKEPIMPGETGNIDVVYSPGKQVNQQTKTVTITANTEPATTVLRIKANVIADPNASAEGGASNIQIQ